MIAVEPPGSDGGAVPDLLHDFTDFYKTTAQRTFGTAYRAAGGDKEVAHDATQEAYVVMWERWRNDNKPQGDVCRYVVGIAVHKVADFYRSIDRWVPLDDEHDCSSDETGHVEVLDSMTVLPVIRDFQEEFDYPEIAEALGIARTTVGTHVHRLRKKLQPLIDRITLDDQGGEQS